MRFCMYCYNATVYFVKVKNVNVPEFTNKNSCRTCVLEWKYSVKGWKWSLQLNLTSEINQNGIKNKQLSLFHCDKLLQVLWTTPPPGSNPLWRSCCRLPSPPSGLMVRGKGSEQCLGLSRSSMLPSSTSSHGTTIRAHCLRWVCVVLVFVTERDLITCVFLS